jgi:hypothetical protein
LVVAIAEMQDSEDPDRDDTPSLNAFWSAVEIISSSNGNRKMKCKFCNWSFTGSITKIKAHFTRDGHWTTGCKIVEPCKASKATIRSFVDMSVAELAAMAETGLSSRQNKRKKIDAESGYISSSPSKMSTFFEPSDLQVTLEDAIMKFQMYVR